MIKIGYFRPYRLIILQKKEFTLIQFFSKLECRTYVDYNQYENLDERVRSTYQLCILVVCCFIGGIQVVVMNTEIRIDAVHFLDRECLVIE